MSILRAPTALWLKHPPADDRSRSDPSSESSGTGCGLASSHDGNCYPGDAMGLEVRTIQPLCAQVMTTSGGGEKFPFLYRGILGI